MSSPRTTDLLLELISLTRRRYWEESELAKYKSKNKLPKNDKWKLRYREPVAPWLPRPSTLPDSWGWDSLDALCPVFVDCAHRTPKYCEIGYPAIRPRDVVGGFLNSEKARRVSVEQYEIQCKRRYPQPGDMLYSRELSYGWAVILPEEIKLCMSQGMVLFRPGDYLLPELVRLFLNGPGRFQAKRLAVGTAHPHLNLSEIRSFSIAVPPPNEQKRIVHKIESLTKLSREIRESLEAMPPLLERVRQSVLAKAFRGDLTKEWREKNPNVEPASKLLKRIRKERRKRWEEAELAKMKAKGKSPKNDKWKQKYKEPEPVDTEGLPDLPEGWCWAKLPELGELNRGKSKHRPRNDPALYGGDHPFIQTGDIRRAEGFIKEHSQTYSEKGLSQSRLWLEHTLCITIAANIAETAILSYPACFPDSVVGFRSESGLKLTKVVEYFFRTAKDDLAQFAPATAQKNINLAVLSQLAVPLIPEPEQDVLLSKLEASFQAIASLEHMMASNVPQLDRLNQSILAKAFRGELVPQDPNDEPASVLLERIKAEREAAAAKSKKGKKKASKKKAVRISQKAQTSGSSDNKTLPIENMSEEMVMAAFKEACSDSSWTNTDKLIKKVSQILGFRRMGTKIKKRLGMHLDQCLRSGIMTKSDDIVQWCGLAI